MNINIQGIIDSLLQTLGEKKLSIPIQAMILAQCEHESGGFKHFEESFAYTVDGLLKMFPRHFKNVQKAHEAVQYGHEYIANFVYQNRMGNGSLKSGDGWRYRGRGLIQITGRSNYREIGDKLKIDLLVRPDLACDHEAMAKIAINFFQSKPYLIKAANEGNVLAVSSWINLGYYQPHQRNAPHGLIERKEYFEKWLKKLQNAS